MVEKATMSDRSPPPTTSCCCIRLHVLVRCCRRRPQQKQCESSAIAADTIAPVVNHTTCETRITQTTARRTISDGIQELKADPAEMRATGVSFRVGVSDDVSTHTDSLMQLYDQSNPDLTRAWTNVYESMKLQQGTGNGHIRNNDTDSNELSLVASQEYSTSQSSQSSDDELMPANTAKRREKSMQLVSAKGKHHSINISPTVDASPTLSRDPLAAGVSENPKKLTAPSLHRSVDTHGSATRERHTDASAPPPSLARSEVVDDLTDTR